MPREKQIQWDKAEASSPEDRVFVAMRTALDIMKNDGNKFVRECSDFILDVSSSQGMMTELQLVAMESAAGQIVFSPNFDYEISNVLNSLIYNGWEELGVKRMPVGAALNTSQRSGLIQLIYTFCTMKIAAEATRLGEIAATAFELPDWEIFAMPNPTNLTAEAASPTEVSLSWECERDSGFQFVVGRSETSGGSYVSIATLEANVTSYTDINLLPDTDYYYVVRSVDTIGNFAFSSEVSVTTAQVPEN